MRDIDGNVIDSGYVFDEQITVIDESGTELTLEDNRPEGEELEELRERVNECVAKPHSEEGREVINNDETHVREVWEDGEITSTKGGDLYRRRSLHQMEPPVFPDGANVLFTPDGEGGGAVTDNHIRMVVTDKEQLNDILSEY